MNASFAPTEGGSEEERAGRLDSVRFKLNQTQSRSPTHKLHPDLSCGEFDESEIIFGVLFVACCDGTVMFDFAEESLDRVAHPVERGAEVRFLKPLRHRANIGPDAALRHVGP